MSRTLYLTLPCPMTGKRSFKSADGYRIFLAFDEVAAAGWVRVWGPDGYESHFPPSSVRQVVEEGQPATQVAPTFVAATQPLLDVRDVDAGGPEYPEPPVTKKGRNRSSTKG